jgi:hypothetical protein
MQFLLKFHKIWFKVFENGTSISFSHIAPFTMDQNHVFMPKTFWFEIIIFLQKMTKNDFYLFYFQTL